MRRNFWKCLDCVSARPLDLSFLLLCVCVRGGGRGVCVKPRGKTHCFRCFRLPLAFHCVESFPIWSFSGPYFPTFGLSTKRYFEYENFSGSVYLSKISQDLHSAMANYRSSRPEVFLKIVLKKLFLKISQNLQENTFF